jgi:hypothetical protein
MKRYGVELKKFLVLIGIGLGIIGTFCGNNPLRAEAKRVYQNDPQSCTKCHPIKPYVETWNGSDFLDHRHAKSQIGCLECHQVTLQQEKEHLTRFKKKRFKTPLEEREYDNEMCLKCHGSYKELIERTKDYKGKGLPRNPHESHYGEMDCNLCHKVHRTSIDQCSQCHQPGVNKPGWKTM